MSVTKGSAVIPKRGRLTQSSTSKMQPHRLVFCQTTLVFCPFKTTLSPPNNTDKPNKANMFCWCSYNTPKPEFQLI